MTFARMVGIERGNRWVCGLALGLALAAGAAAAEDRAADHDALRALAARVTAAINAQDFDTLQGLFTTPFAFTTSEQKTVTTAAELEAYYQRLFLDTDAPLVRLRMQAQPEALTQFVAEDVGYCYGTAEEEYVLRSGRTVQLTSRWTALVVREEGEWKVATVHIGINFLDNPVLARVTDGARRTATVAGAVGLVLGAVAVLLFRRKRG